MTRITILTKLRFIAALAPLLMLLVAPVLAMGFYVFGATPTILNENEFAAVRAASGMEVSLYKMDWGRTQPDGLQIVKDQQRRFASWVSTAHDHADTQAQVDALGRVANAANPIFDAMRKAQPGDDSFEPDLRKLQGLVSDLSNADDAALDEVAARVRSRANVMIGIVVIAGLLVPWTCFAILARMCGRTHDALRDIRARVESLTARAGVPNDDLRAIDERLAELGFPKPNPMLAE
jgi:membrane protein required for beta-lactamase induction